MLDSKSLEKFYNHLKHNGYYLLLGNMLKTVYLIYEAYLFQLVRCVSGKIEERAKNHKAPADHVHNCHHTNMQTLCTIYHKAIVTQSRVYCMG